MNFPNILKRLLRTPGFSLVSVLLLSLAFAALGCVASVVYGLLLKPLPFPDSGQLVAVEARVLGIPLDVGLSTPLRDELAHNAKGIQGIAAYRPGQSQLRDESGKSGESLKSAMVEPGIFSLLGTQAVLGRTFIDEDVAEGASKGVILSWDEWQKRYAGANDAIGRMLRIDEVDYRVVGVLPRDFAFPSANTRLWLPLAFSAESRERSRAGSFDGTQAIARIKPGTERAQVAGELENIAKTMPELTGVFGETFKLKVEPLRSLWVGDRKDALLLMLLAISMVWLVTAANVANLFLARGLQRRQESALIAALGATPWQRARVAIAEAATLCAISVAIGIALLPAGLALLRFFDLLPTGTPQAIGIDVPTLLVMVVLALALCVLLVTVSVSLQRGNLNDMIRRGGARQTAGGGAQMARQSLVVAQVALTVALLFGIGVLLRSSQNLLAEDVGFQRNNLLYTSLLDLVPKQASEELRSARVRELSERVRAMPGAANVGLGSTVPFGISIATISYTPPGTEDSQDRPIAYDQNVDEGYFGALGIPILRGRGFTADEARAKAPVAVIDALFAQRHFGDSDPIGRQFKIGDEQDNANREFTIIGVVPTLKQRALNEVAERASIYRPNASPPYAALVVRTTFDPSALIAPLKAVGEEIGGPNALGTIVALEQRIADTLKDLTRLSGLLGLLGITALLLSAVGIYAVLGYVVRQRVPEFGVRMALGAHASNIVRSVLSQGLRLVGTGLALGVPLAWMFARVLSAKLHGVGTFDLPTLILVSLILGAIGLIACLLPALSAARVDPMVALRNE